MNYFKNTQLAYSIINYFFKSYLKAIINSDNVKLKIFSKRNKKRLIGAMTCISLCICTQARADLTGYGDGTTPPISGGFVDDIRARVTSASGTWVDIANVQGTFVSGKVVLIIDMAECSGG